MENLIIVGTSSTAKQVYEFVKIHQLYNVLGFAVNERYKREDEFMNLPLFSLENLSNEVKRDDFFVFVSVAWNHLNKDRRTTYEYCKTMGYKFANIISPTAIIRSPIKGDNCWIDDFVVIMNHATIDPGVFVKASAVVGANVHISPFCFVGIHATIGGGSSIGEQTFIGLNATIFDETAIGNKCIVGACTAVKRNLPDFSRIVTSSNFSITQYSEEEIENKLISAKNVR